MPLAILVRSAAQTDPPRLLVRDRCVSDHVQSTSGKLSISPARVASVAARLGAGVKTEWDLSKLKSRCRSVTALSITQRGFSTGVELSGPSQVLENVGLFRK